ncbi:MAG: glycosyltransferase [Thermoproteota archaeon]|nr:glycosyltransferase [Thermoproteota archaeon]
MSSRIKKRITIGIPTFNEEKNIMCFFDNLKNQALVQKQSLQIIFVDDSNDNTPFVIEKIKKENPEYDIELYHNEKRMGAANAWNIIFKESRGEITVLLDADIILEKYCIYNLISSLNKKTGLCASNTLPIVEENNIYSQASAFIAYWLRSIRKLGISQYTTMGRALAIQVEEIKDLHIPLDTIAIDLFIQCKILEKHKRVVYNDNAKIYFKTPLNKKDFLNQVSRSIIGHKQIKNYTKRFSFNLSSLTLISEFIKTFARHPKWGLALIYCYIFLPFIYFKNKDKTSYLWEMAKSTK